MATKTLKKEWSPSEAYNFRFCPRAWNIRYLQRLERVEPIDYKMLFGAMYHEATQGIDKQEGFTGRLDAYCERVKGSPTYWPQVWGSETTLEHCRNEIVKEVVPAYFRFINGTAEAPLTPKRAKTLMVERMLRIEYESFVLKCIPDKVIEDPEGKVWVVERKSTSRDDAGWLRQWLLNLQTTTEVVCVEEFLGRPVEGVLIETLVATRKRPKNWPAPWPPPLNTLVFHPWRPVPKSQFIKGQALQHYLSLTREFYWRRAHNEQLFAMNPNECSRCTFNDICRGAAEPDETLAERLPNPHADVEIVKSRSLVEGVESEPPHNEA